MIQRTALISGLCLLLTALPLRAQPYAETTDGWQGNAQVGAIIQPQVDLDTGGNLSVSRAFARLGAAKAMGDDWRLGASLGLGRTDYDFGGAGGFGGLRAWDTINELRLGLSGRYQASEDWTLFAIPSLRFNAESGADLADGMTGGLISGASYKLSDRFSIGPGFGVFSELEDSASFFPILLIDWQITDSLSLETGRGYAASRGPGLQLSWRHSPSLRLALGGRYEQQRFRLDDKGIAPDGVGEKKSIPLFALVEYGLSRNTQLTLIGGTELNPSLRLEDANGQLLNRTDMDTAPFFGANLSARF